VIVSLAGVALITAVTHSLAPVNATTAGFAYLVLVLAIASTWGFIESAAASVAATLTFNFFFFPPVRTFTIADPQNWVALISFLTASLIASRLSTTARRRAIDAMERQQDVERLYTFSRSILLIGESGEPFAKQLIMKLAEVFGMSAAVLYDRRTGEMFRAGPTEFEGVEDQIRDAALQGTSFSDARKNRVITAVRLGTAPIASLALQGPSMPDSVLQGIANLVAVGLERAKAQDLAHQVEAARRSEELRTTLIDAMAHEFKTPLTSIKAATTSLLSAPEQPVDNRTELLRIADEEAEHLRALIDNAVEMARLDTAHIEVHLAHADIGEIVRDVVASMRKEIDARTVEVTGGDRGRSAIPVDQRLIRLALKQMLDNALKYSPRGKPVTVTVSGGDATITVDVTDRGPGLPVSEQARVFERFWRSPSVKKRVPGTGLGLSIAHSIARAHHGDLTVTSRPGETTFRLTLPVNGKGARS
jgi:two-component system sensor histidine kinase KdpD